MRNKKDKYKSITNEEALAKLQSYCAYQDRCHQEVRTKLLDLGIRGYDLENIMSELIQENFLNEERYAKSFVRGKFRIKKWGRIKIRQELRQKNISAYCMKSGFKELEEEDYMGTLREVIAQKDRILNEPNLFKRKGKLAQHAIRRGFESNLVWEVLKSDYE